MKSVSPLFKEMELFSGQPAVQSPVQVPRGYGRVRFPLPAFRSDGFRARIPGFVEPFVALQKSDVLKRQDVLTVEDEDEIHLGCPIADAMK